MAIVGSLEVQMSALDSDMHDRSEFASGIARIDNFLKLSATKQQKADFTRVFVATVKGRADFIGYYALNVHALEPAGFPEALTRRAPHGVIPALYLSMLGVTSSMQGKGLGEHLMMDACARAVDAARHAGVAVLVLDVLQGEDANTNKRRRAFCEGLGFTALTSSPDRMYIPIVTLRKLGK